LLYRRGKLVRESHPTSVQKSIRRRWAVGPRAWRASAEWADYRKLHDVCNLFPQITQIRAVSKSESAEVFWAVSLPRTLCGPLTKATSETENSDLKSQIRLRSATYLARRRALRVLDRE